MRTRILFLFVLGMLLILAGCSITGQTAVMLDEEITGCSFGTGMEFLRINGIVQACYKDSTLYFTVDNKGTNRVSGLQLSVISDYSTTAVLEQTIAPGESSSQKLSFGSQAFRGDVKISVAPYIGESMLLCPNAAIEAVVEEC